MTASIPRRLLVVGSREGSLGEAIHGIAAARGEWPQGSLFTSDLPQTDVTNRKQVVAMLEHSNPTDIVCTVGVNFPDGGPGNMLRNMEEQFRVNAYGPMVVLMEALDRWQAVFPPESGFNFIAVSSNSAHIARSESAGYCASKAALSMAVRSVARRHAATGVVKAWVYEPGWINGTPMSDEVRMRLKANVKPHRIPGGRGVNRVELASRIVEDLVVAPHWLNGTAQRFDGGEQ